MGGACSGAQEKTEGDDRATGLFPCNIKEQPTLFFLIIFFSS